MDGTSYLNTGARNTDISDMDGTSYLNIGARNTQISLIWMGICRECKIQCMEPDVIISPGYTCNVKQMLSNSNMFLNFKHDFSIFFTLL